MPIEELRPVQILVVDDEEAICWSLRRALVEEGYVVETASSAEQGIELAQRTPPDVIVMDVRLPGIDGLTAIGKLRQLQITSPIVLITAFGDLSTAVAAAKCEVAEYLTKPFDLSVAIEAITRTVRRRRDESLRSGGKQTIRPQVGELIGLSQVMQGVFRQIALVAATEMPVVISGESGTGKEMVAQAIHRHSLRSGRPLVPIHLASLGAQLAEGELFGHIAGAFPGANAARVGLLELASGGTAFIDEAFDVPAAAQEKILRVLERRELFAVGDATPRPTDVRLLVATTVGPVAANPSQEKTREWLARLGGLEIHLPRLADRSEDIPQLAEMFLRQSRVPQAEKLEFTQAAMQELCRREWPGNLRELRSCVERAALLAVGGPIACEHLGPATTAEGRAATNPTPMSLDDLIKAWTQAQLASNPNRIDLYERFLAEVEPPLFTTVLDRCLQNRSAAAEILGIHRATLRKRLS